MAKKNDLKDLGEVYGNLDNEAAVVAENLEAQTVGDTSANTGNADIQPGGPTKEGGFEESEVDIKKVGDKNPYNVKGLSYGDDNCPTLETEQPEEQEAGEKKDDPESSTAEEDEEFSKEVLEIAREGLNKYMANKSIFDELYAKVINEDFGMEEVDDLDALGIEDATPDEDLADEGDDAEEEVTITLDKELAQHLCDILKAACGEEVDDADEAADEAADDETEDGEMHKHEDYEEMEEDNEGEPTAFNTHYNDGKSNKVGNTGEGFGQPKVQPMNKVHHKPAAGPSDKGGEPKAHSGSYNDGKNNKVGNQGDGFGQPKVEPMNKAVKA